MNEYVEKVVIDVPSKTFRLYSDLGDEKNISCETIAQFMDILKICTDRLEHNQIEYSKI